MKLLDSKTANIVNCTVHCEPKGIILLSDTAEKKCEVSQN